MSQQSYGTSVFSLAALVSIALIVGPTTVLADDVTGPTITSLTLSSLTVHIGSPLAVTVVATDESGIAGGELDGSALTITSSTATTATLTGFFLVSTSTGVMTLGVVVRDNAGNETADGAEYFVYNAETGTTQGKGIIIPGGVGSQTPDNLPGLEGVWPGYATTEASFIFRLLNNGAGSPASGRLSFKYPANCTGVGEPCFEVRGVSVEFVWLFDEVHEALICGLAEVWINGEQQVGLYPYKLDIEKTNQQTQELSGYYALRLFAPGTPLQETWRYHRYGDPGDSTLYQATDDIRSGLIIIRE